MATVQRMSRKHTKIKNIGRWEGGKRRRGKRVREEEEKGIK